MQSLKICWVAGMMMALTSSWIFLPLRIFGASAISSRRPLVQEPITTCWIGTSPTFVDGLSVFRQMRERNRRLQLGQVDVVRRNVFRVFVWCKDFPFALYSASQIVFCDLIYHEDAVLGSGFDSHVGRCRDGRPWTGSLSLRP